MKSVMQQALAGQWASLPPALQAHYQAESNVDTGSLSVEFPGWMRPFMKILYLVGALLDRPHPNVATVVVKQMDGGRQYWRRTLTYPDGKTRHFNSYWVHSGGNKLIEFVNPLLGLEMAARVVDGRLYYEGVRFVLRVGQRLLSLPEWIALGHTTIVEEALDESRFVMDFRMTHPLLGQTFRYAGKFSNRKLELGATTTEGAAV